MPQRPAPTLAESIAAAQAWWREAGVDHAYHEEPPEWLTGGTQPDTAPSLDADVASDPAEPAGSPVGGDRAAWPQDFASFGQWWVTEPSLNAGGTHPRLAPRGVAGAALLMLVPMPEDGDRETLLAGPQGRLLASFAAAAGLAPDSVTVAAALPRHTPMPDWDGLAASGHGEVLLHLLDLACPRRTIVLGRNILPLLGHGPAQAAPAISELTIQGRAVPLLTTYAPENLLKSARERAGLWQRWLKWTDAEER